MKWSVGWGAACDPCAKAKTRCIRSEDAIEHKCNRCQSLDIPCPQQTRKPRKARLRQQKPTTLPASGSPQQPGYEQNGLEQGTATSSNRKTGALPDPQHGHSTVDSGPNIYGTQLKAEPAGAFNALASLPGFHPFPTPTCTCIVETDGREVVEPPESEGTLLEIYRSCLSPHFPFVIIPQRLAADELSKSRPFLAKAIRIVASLRNRRYMWSQAQCFWKDISAAVFMGPDRSLDLLQSIIVVLGFYHYFCFAHGHFNSLIHLASSIIVDMRLDRPRERSPRVEKGLRGVDPEEPRAMLNDERRAILAVWYLSSSFAVTFKKVNYPGRQFTKHMEQQLEQLQLAPEHESDETLVKLVLAQRANEMIAHYQQSEHMVDVQLSSTAWTASLDSLLAHSNEHECSTDQGSISHRYLLSSHHRHAFLQLLEPQLLGPDHVPYQRAVEALTNTPDYFRAPMARKSDAADVALRAWFDDWLAIPMCHFFYVPVAGWLHLTSATVILLRRARLVLLRRYRQGASYVPHVNMKACNDPEDLMLVLLSRLADRLQEARTEMAAAHCSPWDNDLLDMVAWRLRERRACIERWVGVIASKTQAITRNDDEPEGEGADAEVGTNEGGMSAFDTTTDLGMWSDSFEALLMSGGDIDENWL